MNNPFKYTLDNKRYHTFNYYLKTKYNKKSAKIILNGGFSCPNRDGTKGYGGCTFCSLSGSGDSNLFKSADIMTQYAENKKIMLKKWPDIFFIPYFQSFSNTYGPLDKIKAMIEPFLTLDEVIAIDIATRCDCLKEEVVAYLDKISQKKEIWLELGLQTSNEKTAKMINRGHTFQEFVTALERLKNTNIKVCVHIMNSLKGEDAEDMLQTVKDISHLPFDAIKIHMLHIIKDTKMALEYAREPFPLLTMNEYIDIVIKQLELLDPKVIIERLTGDPIKEELIAPLWTLNKIAVLNGIDKRMAELNTYQGKYYEDNHF